MCTQPQEVKNTLYRQIIFPISVLWRALAQCCSFEVNVITCVPGALPSEIWKSQHVVSLLFILRVCSSVETGVKRRSIACSWVTAQSESGGFAFSRTVMNNRIKGCQRFFLLWKGVLLNTASSALAWILLFHEWNFRNIHCRGCINDTVSDEVFCIRQGNLHTSWQETSWKG